MEPRWRLNIPTNLHVRIRRLMPRESANKSSKLNQPGTVARLPSKGTRWQVDKENNWINQLDTVKASHFTEISPPFFLLKFLFKPNSGLISGFTLIFRSCQVLFRGFTLYPNIVSKFPEATSNRSLSSRLDIPWSWWSCTVPSGSCHTLGRTCGIYSYLTITQWWAMPGGFGRWRCESGHFWSCPSGEKCFRCLWSAVATRTGYIKIMDVPEKMNGWHQITCKRIAT